MSVRDRTRTAILWLKDGSFVTIDEAHWPSVTHGDDTRALEKWVEITGLTVTIETLVRTTGEPK